MPSYFILNDGVLTDSSIYGTSLNSAEVISNTTGVWLSTVDAYSPSFAGDGSSISAVAIHLSARAANPTSSILTLKLSSAASIITETYPVSSFTSYNGSNNLISIYPQNWQILKLTNLYTIPNLSACRLSLATSSPSTLAVMGVSGTNNYNKALINNRYSPSLSGALTVSNTSLSSGSPFGTDVDGSIQFLSASSSTITPPIPLIPATDTFTIEGWFYTKSLGADQSIYSQYLNPGTANRFCFNIEGSSSKLVWSHQGTVGGSSYYSTTVIQTNRWYHFAVSKDYSNTLRIFVDGKLEAINLNYTTPFSLSNPKFGTFNGANFLNGYITNIRASLVPLYTSNFDVPTEPLKAIRGTTFLLNSTSYSENAYYYTTNDFVHIGGALKGSTTEYRTITADSAVLYNLYIHNNGTLTFPSISSKTLTFVGTSGLQITSDGTLNIGTSSELVPSNITHTVILSNTQIDVHNGGNLNVYGSYKLPYTYLLSDAASGSRTFTTTDSVSTSWLSGDVLFFSPNITSRNTVDSLILSSFNSSNTFTTTTTARYLHPSILTLPYVPAVSNISRNIILRGYTSSQRGNIRSIDASKVNINNTQFNHFGFNTARYRGLSFNPNLNGSAVLSGCAIEINSFNGAEINNFTGAAGIWITNNKSYAHNIKIDNNFIGYTIDANNNTVLSSVSTDNFIYTNNLIISGGAQGGSLTVDSVTGKNVLVKDNYVIGSGTNSTKVNLCNLSGSFGVTNYLSLSQGLQINLNASSTSPIFSSIKSLSCGQEGIYINASSVGSNINSLSFDGLTALNCGATGFTLYGNNSNYLTPFNLNINNFTSSKNTSAFSFSNITGTLSNVLLSGNFNSNHLGNINIGNGKTIISNITSIDNFNISPASIAGTPILSSASPFGVGVDGSFYADFNNTITLNPTPNLNFGTGDFTIELWVYPTNPTLSKTIFALGAFNDGILFSMTRGDWLYISSGAYAIGGNGAPFAVPINAWTHIAFVRYAGVTNIYYNGISRFTHSGAYTITDKALKIGSGIGTQTEDLKGFVSNVRVVKGYAVYKSNFTTPTSPLKPISNTVFLYKSPNYGTSNYIRNSWDVITIGGTNYNETIINNFVTGLTGTSPLILDNTKYEHFVLQNSDLGGTTTNNTITINNVLEGSYGFHNNIFDITSSMSAAIIDNYQSDTYTETGFAFMRHNQLGDNHFKISKAGKVSFDRSVYNAPNTLSERLEPYSSTSKLRSTKLIPINTGDQYTISVTIKKSANYTGAAPRLILKHNGSLGYNQDVVLATSILGNNVWETLMGSLPSASLDNGMIEIYVDCSGNSGSGYINIDSWRFL